MARPVLIALGALLALACPLVAPDGRSAGDSRALAVDSSRSPVLARMIVRTQDPPSAAARVAALGGRTLRRLDRVGAIVADVPADRVASLHSAAGVDGVSPDRRLHGTLATTASATGARWVLENLGFDGAGIGVAVIDSGVAPHAQLAGSRLAHFVDFVDVQPLPHDGYGHGTHVAGIIAAGGTTAGGEDGGIAPGAHLVVLRALDGRGEGYISDAMAALDYAIEGRTAYNIRVVNLSVAAGVYESYMTDPLTLAARRAVEAGIVVVTAAGNQGRDAHGRPASGGITSPGNAPWVVTVGAANHQGTADPADDRVAGFSSVGPSFIDGVSKPDLVAPGVGIRSLADPDGALALDRQSRGAPADSYLTLSGTSMAAPVVSGTVALMLQANTSLDPASVKAILRESAIRHPAYHPFVQGAGFLDARAAVSLARGFATAPGGPARLRALVRRQNAAAAAACGGDAPCGAAIAACADGRCDRPVAGALAPMTVRAGGGDAHGRRE